VAQFSLRSNSVRKTWLVTLHSPERDRISRAKRIAIVALARKLIVALWRYLTTGLVPEQATMKA